MLRNLASLVSHKLRIGLALCTRAELLVSFALLATIATIYFERPLLNREINITADDAGQSLGAYSYSDATNGGASRVAAIPNQPLSWACHLAKGYEYPFCGTGIMLTAGLSRGVDLSKYDSVQLLLDFHGPGHLLRVYLKNSNPAYSRPGDLQSDKYNYADLAASQGSQRLDVPLSEFAVADWWKSSRHIPSSLGKPEFTNVVGFEVQVGLDGHLGDYTLRLKRITFERRLLTEEQFYGILAAFWFLLIVGLLWQRRVQLRKLERQEAIRLRWASEHDSLTQLPNRSAFQCRLQTAILNAMQRGSSVALLLVDLDHFKHVNDSLGHGAGDELLKGVAARLLNAIRDDAFIARIGGDEFALIINDAGEDAQILSIGNRIIEALKSPVRIEGRQVVIGATVGAAIFPRNVTCGGELFNAADTALYALKHSGRGGTQIFDDALMNDARRSASHLSIARAAATERRVVPFYQPIVDLVSGEMIGFEALLRCGHLARLNPPAILEEAFADYELAAELALLMHHQVASDVAKWAQDGGAGRVAINASPTEFLRDDFAERFLNVLAEHSVTPDRFIVEVTEHVFLGRANDYVSRAIKLLKDAGVQIALDDFGTGYSSLSHLRDLRVDTVKMDKSFIDKILEGGEAAAIVAAVISLAKSLGIKTVAEGVETEPQAQLLRSMGCDQAQGYLFGRPVDATTIAKQIFREAA